MASLQKEYDDTKLNGVVYTPQHIVEKMLDEIQYDNEQILGKKIIDPACGDGRFLCEIVRRILKFSPLEDLEKNLLCVYGCDVDQNKLEDCKKNLDHIIQHTNLKVDWNIRKQDATKIKKTDYFHYFVSNPPYIRIQHLSQKSRDYIQNNFTFCQKGSTDIYIAFFELALKLIKKDGRCAFITPNTYFYTDTAQKMRDEFSKNGYISKLINYGDIQIFEDATTYSAICYFDKENKSSFPYLKAIDLDNFTEIQINTSDLVGKKFWSFSNDFDATNGKKKLGQISKISVGISTLCDKAYVMEILQENENTYTLKSKIKGNVEIEKEILKPVIKASKYKTKDQRITEMILYPYDKATGKAIIIEEDRLKTDFPMAYNYLLSVKPELDKRDAGKPNPVAWYAYGRSQGLDTAFGKKIIFSPMNKEPNFVLAENEEALFYSGYSIKYNGDYDELLPKINSEEMKQFIQISSRDYRGAWKAYNKKVVAEFPIQM